jgi:hypothetical protein
MKFKKIELQYRGLTAFMEGLLVPEISDNDRKVETYVLSSYRPPANPDWILQMRGSHRRVVTIEWCISTMVLAGKDVDDDTVEVALMLPRSYMEYEVLKKVKTSFSNQTPREIEVGSEENDQYRAIYNLCRRIHNGYSPRIDFLKKWDPVRVAPKAFIGKGYTDQGHVSTTLSWQEQMISADELTIPDSKSFLGLLLAL